MEFIKKIALLIGIILLTSPIMTDGGPAVGASCAVACTAAFSACTAGSYC